MNWFDHSILHFLNSFAGRSWIADATLVQIADNNFLVGAVLMAMFWWAWITYGKKGSAKREILAANLGMCAVAVDLARVLALALPYRERPIRSPLLHFNYPFTADPESLIHWSSFPSDHAVLDFCIATGLWMVSRRLGILAISYALLTNAPRIYAGTHFPTDVIAGAALGAAMAPLCDTTIIRGAAALEFLDRYPALLFALLYAWTFEIAEMFNSLRTSPCWAQRR
ncbi:MAG TPA: phosphatase PAP2 family protein [Terriglobia bacterium]|nr:phosphatase PAP2 family protein [Terriglobia bacterium]